MKNKTIRLTIDDIPVEIEQGKTLLEAAQSAGIRIPTLCHDRRLVPFGACRLCMVEQKGKSELLPSCFTPAKNGMEILTHSPRIIESRRIQLQLILLNHPMTCPRCEKEGECDLQSLVYEYGLNDTQYPWNLITFPVDDASPLLQRDGNKCILCGRCVRICDEVQGVGELSFTRRGIHTLIDTDFHRPLECEFCGQCLDTCPVGAITSNCFEYKTKAWELTETTSPCPYCGVGCLLVIGSKEGEIKRVFSTPDHGPNDGNLCVKGRFGWDFVDSPERLKSPLLRLNGKLEEVSWEEALRFIVQRLEEIKEKSGSESIGAIVSDRLTNEEYFLFKKLFKEGLGSDQIACHRPSEQGLARGLLKTFGMAASTNSIGEIRKADCIVMIGEDPAQTHPIIKNEIHLAIRKNRAQLIVLGSSDIGLSRSTQINPLSPPPILLLTKPERELLLLDGMIGMILKQGLEKDDFIKSRTEGIDELKKRQEQYLSLLSEEERFNVERAARAYAQSHRSMILIGSGPWSYSEAEGIAIASSNLSLLTGHIGKESSGILLLLEKSNSQGAIDSEIVSDGKGEMDLIKKAEEATLKALYLIGKNPPLSPHALKNLELLIVQDLFMTDSAKEANVVLPACSFVEKSGTYTNLERRIQRLHPIRQPIGQSKSDFEIFLRLLHLLEIEVSGGTPEEIFEEISKAIPSYQSLQDGKQWPEGLGHLYEEGFPSGKARLIPLAQPGPVAQMDTHPFHLIQTSSLFQSGKLSLRSEHLKRVRKKPVLKMNQEDARLLKIEDGEALQITTHEGRSAQMKVEVSSKPARSVIATSSSSLFMEGKRICFAKVETLKKS